MLARERTSLFSVCNSNLHTQSPDPGMRGEMHMCGGFQMCQALPGLDISLSAFQFILLNRMQVA